MPNEAMSARRALGWAVLFACAITLFPYDFDVSQVSRSFDWRPFPYRTLSEWAINVALFMPVGFGAARLLRARAPWQRLLAGVAVGGLICVGVEVVQQWLRRYPGLSDIISNLAGAALGAGLQVAIGPAVVAALRGLAARLRAMSAAAAATMISSWWAVTLVAAAGLLQPPALSTWDPAYRLAVGHELDGKRPWRGSISSLWVAAGPTPAPTGDLESAVGPDARTTDWRSETAVRIAKSDAFALFVRFESDAVDQRGPARIVTISKDIYHRNLTVGQQGADLIVRLRSTITGENGERPAFVIPGVFAESLSHAVLVRHAAGVTTVYVDSVARSFRFELTKWAELSRGILTVEAWDLEAIRLLWYALVNVTFGMIAGMVRRRTGAWSIVAALGLGAAHEALLAVIHGRGLRADNLILAGFLILAGVALHAVLAFRLSYGVEP